MRVVHEQCCGLDVHKRTVVACVLTPEGKQTRTFATMTQDLIALADWLLSMDVNKVAMESTGVVRGVAKT
jgi:transposase